MSYPTLEELLCSDVNQCITWEETLPAPQTDVERTVKRRITIRLEMLLHEKISADEDRAIALAFLADVFRKTKEVDR